MQFSAIDDVYSARQRVLLLSDQLIGFANSLTTTLMARSGSCRNIDAHVRTSNVDAALLEIELLIDFPARSEAPLIDAMVAKMAPLIEQLTHGKRGCIAISGIAERQLFAQLTLSADSFPLTRTQAAALAGRLVDLHDSTSKEATVVSARNKELLGAANDVYAAIGAADRCAARALAPTTPGSDQGTSLAIWYHDHHGDLAGRVALPLQVGGADDTAAAVHAPTSVAAEIARTVHPIEQAITAIALAQSLASLHAHATDAIAWSSPALHAHDLALMAGASGCEINQLVQAMLSARTFRLDHVVAELGRMRSQ